MTAKNLTLPENDPENVRAEVVARARMTGNESPVQRPQYILCRLNPNHQTQRKQRRQLLRYLKLYRLLGKHPRQDGLLALQLFLRSMKSRSPLLEFRKSILPWTLINQRSHLRQR